MDSKLGSSEMAGYRVLLSYIFFAICFQNVSITLKLSKAYSAMVLEVFEHFLYWNRDEINPYILAFNQLDLLFDY